jgi:hypothetical protein
MKATEKSRVLLVVARDTKKQKQTPRKTQGKGEGSSQDAVTTITNLNNLILHRYPSFCWHGILGDVRHSGVLCVNSGKLFCLYHHHAWHGWVGQMMKAYATYLRIYLIVTQAWIYCTVQCTYPVQGCVIYVYAYIDVVKTDNMTPSVLFYPRKSGLTNILKLVRIRLIRQ